VDFVNVDIIYARVKSLYYCCSSIINVPDDITHIQLSGYGLAILGYCRGKFLGEIYLNSNCK